MRPPQNARLVPMVQGHCRGKGLRLAYQSVSNHSRVFIVAGLTPSEALTRRKAEVELQLLGWSPEGPPGPLTDGWGDDIGRRGHGHDEGERYRACVHTLYEGLGDAKACIAADGCACRGPGLERAQIGRAPSLAFD